MNNVRVRPSDEVRLLGIAVLAQGVGLCLLLYLLLAFSLARLACFFPPLYFWSPILALVLAAVAMKTVMGQSHVCLIILLAGLLVVGSVLLANVYYDVTWDGKAYHQEAIAALAHGGNSYQSGWIEPSENSIWIACYPKFSWVYGASMVKLTGSMESAKSLSLLVPLAAGLVCWSILCSWNLAPAWAAVGVGLAVGNPVILVQVFSSYVDGIMAALLMVLVGCLCSLWRQETGRRCWVRPYRSSC